MDLILRGDLESIGDIQIDGQVYGDVKSRSLTVGENAKVTGGIMADSVRICGRVEGHVEAKSVVLTVSSKVIGDVVHETLEIEAGAFIHGHCRRKDMESEQRLSDAAAEIIADSKSGKSASGKSAGTAVNGKDGAKEKDSDSSSATSDSGGANVEKLAEKKTAVGD
ncbi:bactofilin family protein [Rhodovibrionaceae bacterium A322]